MCDKDSCNFDRLLRNLPKHCVATVERCVGSVLLRVADPALDLTAAACDQCRFPGSEG